MNFEYVESTSRFPTVGWAVAAMFFFAAVVTIIDWFGREK